MSRIALPRWIKEPPPVTDEVIPGPWGYHALQMANRSYRPPQMTYRRTVHGDDWRLKYMLYFLDLRGLRVLELGPYEGYHSILLEKLGVAELVSVEARPENVAKCERIKQKYQLDRTTIIQQDIEKICSGEEAAKFGGNFDLVFCAGFLYHLPNPALALRWMRHVAPQLFLATHYYEAEAPESYQGWQKARLARDDGPPYHGVLYREGGFADPLSGMSEVSFWAAEADLVRMIQDAGYSSVSVLGKDVHSRNGFPHITIKAES